jgi:hypothetical protein
MELTLWSALPCQRFGIRRPVAAVFAHESSHNSSLTFGSPKDGGDRSPNTKAVTGYRTSKLLPEALAILRGQDERADHLGLEWIAAVGVQLA